MLDTIIFTAANCLISTGLTIQLNFEAIYNICASKVVIEQTQTIVVHSCICSLSLFKLFLGLPCCPDSVISILFCLVPVITIY